LNIFSWRWDAFTFHHQLIYLWLFLFCIIYYFIFLIGIFNSFIFSRIVFVKYTFKFLKDFLLLFINLASLINVVCIRLILINTIIIIRNIQRLWIFHKIPRFSFFLRVIIFKLIVYYFYTWQWSLRTVLFFVFLNNLCVNIFLEIFIYWLIIINWIKHNIFRSVGVILWASYPLSVEFTFLFNSIISIFVRFQSSIWSWL
jgi:hypothetical protein